MIIFDAVVAEVPTDIRPESADHHNAPVTGPADAVRLVRSHETHFVCALCVFRRGALARPAVRGRRAGLMFIKGGKDDNAPAV
jgi:hypothetical protein